MRESPIERYLVRKVKAAGGECRKLKGRKNEPDRMVLWPGNWIAGSDNRYGTVVFVETKATGKKPRAGQRREHGRLRKMGFRVLVLDSKALVDQYITGESGATRS